MQKRYIRGFTLIETLFVIAILSVIASMGVAVYQQRTSTAKVEKAAVQLQLFSQAVTDYFNDNGKWPIPLNTTTLGQYIPYGDTSNKQYLNPWGKAYTSATTETDAPSYNITTDTPNLNTADQIKAKLPFAEAKEVSNKAQLQLAIPAPGTMGTANYIFIAQGWVKLNLVTQKKFDTARFTCPRGYIGGISIALRGLMTDAGNTGRIANYNYSMGIYQAGVGTSCTKSGTNSYQCSLDNLLYTNRVIKLDSWYCFWNSCVMREPMQSFDNQETDYSGNPNGTNQFSYLEYNYTNYCYRPYTPADSKKTPEFHY